MVTQWGFSDKLGPLLYAEEEGEVFLGRSVAKAKHMSDETARIIDQEVKALIERNYGRARQILNDNMDILHSMKDALMKYELAAKCVRQQAGKTQVLPTILTTMAPRVRRVRSMNRVRRTRATPCQNSWATSKSLLLKRLSVSQTLELAPGFFFFI